MSRKLIRRALKARAAKVGPTPEQVNQLEAALKQHGKEYEFHRYDGASHGFFYYFAPMYRPEATMDGWEKIFAFFGNKLR